MITGVFAVNMFLIFIVSTVMSPLSFPRPSRIDTDQVVFFQLLPKDPVDALIFRTRSAHDVTEVGVNITICGLCGRTAV